MPINLTHARWGLWILAISTAVGCASSAPPDRQAKGPLASTTGMKWQALGAADGLVPISVASEAGDWRTAGAESLDALPAAPVVQITDRGVWVDGRQVTATTFRAGAILSDGGDGRGVRRPKPGAPIAELQAAFAPSAAGAPFALLADARSSVDLVVAVVASAQAAGHGAPLWLAEGPEQTVWMLPVMVSARCPEHSAPPLEATDSSPPNTSPPQSSPSGKSPPPLGGLPHRWSAAPLAVWGPCAPEAVQAAFTRIVPALAKCEKAAVETAPILRGETDRLELAVMFGLSGEVEGLYQYSRFAGADRALMPCLADKLRSLKVPPAGRRCLAQSLFRFDAGNEPDAAFIGTIDSLPGAASLAAPLTWAQFEVRRQGLRLELGHANASACPSGSRLFARLEDPRANVLRIWLDDLVGDAAAFTRLDLVGESAVPIADLLSLGPAAFGGRRAKGPAKVNIAVTSDR